MAFDGKNMSLDQVNLEQAVSPVDMPGLDPVNNLRSLVEQQEKEGKAGPASLDNLNTGSIYPQRPVTHQHKHHRDSPAPVHDKVLPSSDKTGVESDTPEASRLKNWADKHLQEP